MKIGLNVNFDSTELRLLELCKREDVSVCLRMKLIDLLTNWEYSKKRLEDIQKLESKIYYHVFCNASLSDIHSLMDVYKNLAELLNPKFTIGISLPARLFLQDNVSKLDVLNQIAAQIVQNGHRVVLNLEPHQIATEQIEKIVHDVLAFELMIERGQRKNPLGDVVKSSKKEVWIGKAAITDNEDNSVFQSSGIRKLVDFSEGASRMFLHSDKEHNVYNWTTRGKFNVDMRTLKPNL